ncbi:MAG: transcriptional regulator [Planctomycetaceae bacterium]|nr:transcriptional regulator [Planctomycetaceae bacterium]
MGRGEPLFRQWELLKTLQANRFGITADELAQRLECNKRTVLRDLDVLQTHFPLRTDHRENNRKYWKLDSGYLESEKLQMTMTEMLSLYLSQQLLAPLAGTPFGDGLNSALQKIRAVLPTKALSYFSDLDDAFLIKTLASHDYSGQTKEIELLNEAIINRQVLRVVYCSASQGRDMETVFHPYGMVVLSSSLYCIGWLAEYDEVRTLKVSRFKGVRATSKSFEKPKSFSLTKHTHGAFGIFGPGKFQKIKARFTGWAATNVREQQWHPSQRITKDDGQNVVATFELSNTVEFVRWVLGFGEHATMLSPKALAGQIATTLERTIRSYRSSAGPQRRKTDSAPN